jgi:hypothetical protein
MQRETQAEELSIIHFLGDWQSMLFIRVIGEIRG